MAHGYLRTKDHNDLDDPEAPLKAKYSWTTVSSIDAYFVVGDYIIIKAQGS